MAVPKPSVPKNPKKCRILIVDDHPLLREGLRGVINRVPDMMVCGEAENASQAMSAVQKLAPDLALVDITLPGRSGLELVKDLQAAHPHLVILAISMHDESLYAERVLRAGASGYITKQQPPGELIKAIRQVRDRHIYVSKQVSESLLRRISLQSREEVSPVSLLTDREFEIMRMMGAGKAPSEIARQLHLSPKTIAVHTSNVRRKLNLKTTAQLIRFSVQWEDLRNPTRD
jgi:DNA-binding NarL/FixJ family response regulator